MNEELKRKIKLLETSHPKRPAVNVTFTDKDKDAIDAAARECGLSTSEFVRSLCMLALEES